MKKPRLKTAKEVREEIFAKYFELKEEVGTGVAAYKGRVTSLQNETCFNERDCLGIIKTKDDILDEILQKYFRLTKSRRYKDSAENIYGNREDAIDSLDKGLYNQKNISERIKSGEVVING